METKGRIVVLSSVVIILIGILLSIIPCHKKDNDRILFKNKRYIEELGLYFYATDIQSEAMRFVCKTIFTAEEGNQPESNACNFMVNTDYASTDPCSLQVYDNILRFCKLDNTMLCVVSKNVMYQSADYPIITYDDEGFIVWKGERYWLFDVPFMGVYCSMNDPYVINWYPYDPKIDRWYAELLRSDAAKVCLSVTGDEFLSKHQKNAFPKHRTPHSAIHQNGGLVYYKGEWIPRKISTVTINVREQIKQSE